jgi:hypothetical protein
MLRRNPAEDLSDQALSHRTLTLGNVARKLSCSHRKRAGRDLLLREQKPISIARSLVLEPIVEPPLLGFQHQDPTSSCALSQLALSAEPINLPRFINCQDWTSIQMGAWQQLAIDFRKVPRSNKVGGAICATTGWSNNKQKKHDTPRRVPAP